MSSFLKSSTSSTRNDSWFPALQFSNRRKNPTDPPKPSPVVVDPATKEEIPPTPRDKSVEEEEKHIQANPIVINSKTKKIERPLNSIVPVSVKKYPPFQNELAYLSRSDAHHDLGDLFKDSMYKKESRVATAFDSALPVPATVAFHEGNAFASVVISATNPSGSTINIHTGDNKQEDYLQEALNQVPDCTARDTGVFSTFAIGIGGDYIFKYRVVRFVTKCSNNESFKGGEKLDAIACKSNFGKNFVTNTKLGEDTQEAAIIVDFSQHHFMESLASGEPDNFKIRYLMTPEVVNDPAGKPNVNNKSLFGLQDKGIKLQSYVQTDPEPISYTKYNEFEPSTSNNFFSNYDFTLSPIKQIFTKQKAEKLITTLNISYNGAGGKINADPIEDSKGENSITTVLGYLRKILTQIQGTGGSPIEKFNFNSKIQQKRGGDWFQALSCLTAKNRTYTRILPTRGTPSPLNPTCPVYLVTHDRIAVAFALLNGVNVIYLDYYGRIFIFKNGGDPTLKSSGKTMEHILFDGIKSEWKPTDTSIKTFSDTLNTAQIYTTVRNRYIARQYDDFIAVCTAVNAVFSNIPTTLDRDALFQRNVTENLRILFTSAVKLVFININLTDITSDFEYVNSFNISIFNRNYDERYQQDVAKFSKALNNIKSIKDRFGNMAPPPAQILASESDKAKFETILPIWVDSNSKKIDEYRVANKILETTRESTSFDLNRLLSIFSSSNSEERKTDMHIFLPFIQVLDDSYKTRICDIINVLANKTSEYYNNVVQRSKSGRSGISSQQAYYNSLANLLYESLIFLKPSSTSSTTVKPESSTSTDNILLNEDYADLSIMKKDGKFSGNTENAPEDPAAAASTPRGGAKFIDLSRVPKKESVICDVSVKQVTWTLLTANLVDTNSNANVFSTKITNMLDLDELKTKNPADAKLIEGIRSLIIPEDKISVAVAVASTANALLLGGGGQSVDAAPRTTTAPKTTAATTTAAATTAAARNSVSSTSTYIIKTGDKFNYPPWGLCTAMWVGSDLWIALDPDKTDGTKVIKTLNGQGTSLLQGFEIDVSWDKKKILKASMPNASTIRVIHDTAGPVNFTRVPSSRGGEGPSSIDNLMLDYDIGVHPLTPIYSMLTSYYNIIGKKSQSDPFFYTYFTYINVLEKMKKVIEENYLTDITNKFNVASAYMIGFGLYTMLFASHTSLIQNNQIISVIQMSQHEYHDFSLKNDCFASTFSGAIIQTPEDEAIGLALISNNLFSNFINNEVNIKQILQQGTLVDNLPGYTVLKDRIFKLMGEIVVKVNADRGTPIASTTTSSGIAGISQEEASARAARGQQKYEENLAKGLIKPQGIQDTSKLFTYSQGEPGNVVTSTTGQRTRGGKRRSKRYLINKRKTIKNRPNKKTNTKKRYRRTRRTKKY